MTQGTTAYGGTFALELGDGNTPENFTTVGGYKSKTFTLTGASSTEQVPDNDNPDSAVWDETIVTSLSAGLTATGMMTAEVLPTIETWFISGVSKNVRLRMSKPQPLAGRTYEFAAVLTKSAIGAPVQKKYTHDIELKSTGAVTIAST